MAKAFNLEDIKNEAVDL
ncbi:hypothetical protein SOVF_191700, partial [Spinacia oleracea]